MNATVGKKIYITENIRRSLIGSQKYFVARQEDLSIVENSLKIMREAITGLTFEIKLHTMVAFIQIC